MGGRSGSLPTITEQACSSGYRVLGIEEARQRFISVEQETPGSGIGPGFGKGDFAAYAATANTLAEDVMVSPSCRIYLRFAKISSICSGMEVPV